ncbi:FAD-binding oxidoreductase [Amycolatopsis nigrescens]|uniref:FAD-binding oxidoreductase n=1 Tax=Amycolatopsis nigrescens TaxID=381445 RepID=UPI00036EB9FE|nr:FAD-binding oxidoreductase [Amycolatopsis nigrescens]
MNRADIEAPALDALRDRVKGPVFRPADEGYDEERSGYQTADRHRPDVVVGAVDAEDVRVAVEFAGEHGLPVAVQATGHGLPLAADGGLLVSTRRMTEVQVDPDRATAWLAAGVRWAQVVQETAKHELAPLSGSAPHVGAVSYTLGGGIGLLARKYGYAVDRVRAIEVVTADARLRLVTPDSDPDLFWALCGGRANFGVVTRLEIGLVPVTRLYGGGMYFDAEHIPALLETYRQWVTTVPDELTSSVAMVPMPDVPALPEPLRGRHIAHVRIAYLGDAAEGERLVAPLREVGPRLIDAIGELPYTESGTIHNEPDRPAPYHSTHALLRELDPATIRSVLELAGPGAPDACVLEIRHLGGALAEPPAVPNSVGHREATFVLAMLSILDDAGADPVLPAHRRFADLVAPWSVGTSVNFLYGRNAADEEVRTAYRPADLRRLTELKARYDPANLFRLNHNIPPAG